MITEFVIVMFDNEGHWLATSKPFGNYPNEIAIASFLDSDVRAKYVLVEKRYIRGEEQCGSATNVKVPSARNATERAE
jgi:hypothetical protein